MLFNCKLQQKQSPYPARPARDNKILTWNSANPSGKKTITASARNPLEVTDTTRLMDITSEALNITFNDLRDTAVLLLIRTV
jgi:hypothetical protein